GVALPFLRLDYIWYSPELRATKAYTGPFIGADHLPVIVQLELK
ncbi:MAG: endonuclease/exonuclease/phosphatase, partial [Chloroflexi bacterium]|nr:endonuclease/exonuclease/phosphatase [Chloroflexota bacterium]